jgi:hypothetical protein
LTTLIFHSQQLVSLSPSSPPSSPSKKEKSHDNNHSSGPKIYQSQVISTDERVTPLDHDQSTSNHSNKTNSTRSSTSETNRAPRWFDSTRPGQWVTPQETQVIVLKPPISNNSINPPRLLHGLERVLFQPGTHWLQDSRTKVYNFPKNLKWIPKLEDLKWGLGGVGGRFRKPSTDPQLDALGRWVMENDREEKENFRTTRGHHRN